MIPKRSLQQLGELAPVRLGVAARAHGHVRGQRREAGADLPDVQVVDLDHVVLGRQRVADLARVEVARRRLEQHPARVAQQAEAREEHQRGHEQRRDPVGAREAGEQDERARHGRGDEREQVVQHVLERALHVQALAVRPGEDQRRGQVHPDPDHGDDQHGSALDVGRVDEPPDALDADHGAERDQRRAVQLGRQDLGAPEAEREVAARRPAGQVRGEQRQRDGAGVGEHVRRVGEQGE